MHRHAKSRAASDAELKRHVRIVVYRSADLPAGFGAVAIDVVLCRPSFSSASIISALEWTSPAPASITIGRKLAHIRLSGVVVVDVVAFGSVP
jgi:hypothetical protein